MAEDFLNNCLIHCPPTNEPTARRDVLSALCKFASKPPYFSHTTRDALQRALELLVENGGDVAIQFPTRRTVYPYLVRAKEEKVSKKSRMLKLKPGWDADGVGFGSCA